MKPCMQKYTTGGQKAYSCHKLLTPPSQRQHLLTISMHLIRSSCEEETGLRQSSAEKLSHTLLMIAVFSRPLHACCFSRVCFYPWLHDPYVKGNILLMCQNK